MRRIDVVVIGAGQAGLSTAHHLQRAGVDHVVLDRGAGPGGAWRNRWPSLRLGGVHGIHPLPGSAPPEAGDARPAAEVVAEYFGRYEREFALPVLRPVRVEAVRDGGERLLVESSAGTWAARAVVNATGTWDNPFWPHYPGRHLFTGRQLHTADYRGPAEFRGQRVVVVGGGLAGLAAALRLAKARHPVRLYEASDRLGGRWASRTLQLPGGSVVLDDAPPVLEFPAPWRDLFRKSGRTLVEEFDRSAVALSAAEPATYVFADGAELRWPTDRGEPFAVRKSAG